MARGASVGSETYENFPPHWILRRTAGCARPLDEVTSVTLPPDVGPLDKLNAPPDKPNLSPDKPGFIRKTLLG